MPDLSLLEGAGILAVPHPIETCYGSRLHCMIHGVDEPDGGYRSCGECWHVFRTAADLLGEHNRISQQARPGRRDETDPGRVFCCPFCCHDW